jgi:hypothetical protein
MDLVEAQNLGQIVTLHIFAQSMPWQGGVQLLILGRSFDERRTYQVSSIEVEEHEASEVFPDSSIIHIRYEVAQRLMDDLWNCGLRPTEGTGSAGSLKATQTHLEDMRKIAFRFLEDDND